MYAGILFEDGKFQEEKIEIELADTEDNDWDNFMYENGYNLFFEINKGFGVERTGIEIRCYFYYRDESNESEEIPKNFPRYIFEIMDDFVGGHETFFIKNILDLNSFLKEMNPLIEMAKSQGTIEINRENKNLT